MIGITILILGIALAFPTKQPIDDSRAQLSCNAPASDFDQGTCYLLDMMKFLFVGGVILTGLYILTKVP